MRYRSLLALLVAAPALAGGGRVWRLSSFADFDAGEPRGARVGTPGEVRPGFATERTAVEAQAVWCALAAADGSVWLGTGDEGRVLRVEGGRVSEVARLDAVLVTALVEGDGVVYAGTLPGGAVHAIGKDGKARLFSKLEAEHVWALAWDASARTLFAATGPDGKLFAIDAAGKARLHFDSKQKHLMALAPDGAGGLWAGSSDEAILYRVAAGGRGFAVADLPGTEIRALAVDPAGAVWVAANEFEQQKGAPPSPPEKGPAAGAAASPRPGAAKGKGAIYRILPDGDAESIHALPSGTVQALLAEEGGAVWAATAPEGRVLIVQADHTAYTVLDLEERQALALARRGERRFVGTGDGAAFYAVGGEPAAPEYLARPLDAGFVADWGTARWRASGPVELDARAGNTAKPDASWSEWQPIARAGAAGGVAFGRPRSPPARYLQLRVRWPRGSDATLTEVAVHYLPRNQRARVSDITLGDEKPPEKGAAPAAASAPPPAAPRRPVLKLRWKAENPDGDPLVYRASFREESEIVWRPIGGPDPLEKAELEWNTESIADGTYRVKVEASDERANPASRLAKDALVSDPILVDNRKPEVLGLAVSGGAAAGRAADGYSPIEALEYAIDGGPWTALAPRDRLLDDLVEAFGVDLPSDLAPGAHTLAVRATDAAGNVGVAQASFRR